MSDSILTAAQRLRASLGYNPEVKTNVSELIFKTYSPITNIASCFFNSIDGSSNIFIKSPFEGLTTA
ncbi:MAG TPA: hypothetical protein PKY81_09680 [bacterium]|nr:hypothetical protein [bacterium]